MKAIDKLRELYHKQPSKLPDHAKPTFGSRYRAKKPEKRIKMQICDYINWSGHFAKVVENHGQYRPGEVQYNVIGKGVQVKKPKYIYSANMRGQADISAIIAGKPVEIELKRKYKQGKDRQSDEQKAYQEAIEKAGGTYIIVSDLEDFHGWYTNNT